jgi:hypothetical protein
MNARDFLAARRRWLRIRTVPGEHGGHDIAIVVDGSYSDAGDAQRLGEYWAGQLAEVLADENITAQAGQ